MYSNTLRKLQRHTALLCMFSGHLKRKHEVGLHLALYIRPLLRSMKDFVDTLFFMIFYDFFGRRTKLVICIFPLWGRVDSVAKRREHFYEKPIIDTIFW